MRRLSGRRGVPGSHGAGWADLRRGCSGRRPALPGCEGLSGVSPILQAGLRLGEGTGAVAVLPILDMAMAVYNGDTFADIQIDAYVPQS